MKTMTVYGVLVTIQNDDDVVECTFPNNDTFKKLIPTIYFTHKKYQTQENINKETRYLVVKAVKEATLDWIYKTHGAEAVMKARNRAWPQSSTRTHAEHESLEAVTIN